MSKILCFFSVLGLAFALPALLERSLISLVAQTGDDNDFDPSDLSFITKMAAIGDSYSAGIGAGDRLGSFLDGLNSQGDWACSRYDHAYPYLVNNDPALGDPAKRAFQFLSCSGALSKDVLEKQIPKLNADQQVILLSVGGNDVELVNILNQCIFQFAVLNPQQVIVAKLAVEAEPENYAWAKDFDFDTLGRGCATQLDQTAAIIGSSTFSSNLDQVLNAAKAKLAKDGKIYMTGYGKFFAEDLSPDCNSVTWTTWIYKSFNMFQEAQYLTQDHRKRMNGLVESVNAQLKAAVDRAGPSVVFVDYDPYIGEFHGRYCEAGVNEATTESNTRIPLMFYELNSFDPLGSTPWKRTTNSELNGTFAGSLDIFAQITLLMDKDAQYKIPEANVSSAEPPAAPGIVSNLDLGDIEIPSILPDGYGRVFHPQILLHEIIANMIIYNMIKTNQQSHGFPSPPQDLAITACPYTPPMPTLHSSSTAFGSMFLSFSTRPGSSCVGTGATALCEIPGKPCATMFTCASWEAITTAAPTATTATAAPPASTTAPPVNTPPPDASCNGNDSDCSQYTCPGGKQAHCGTNNNGDPFSMFCEC